MQPCELNDGNHRKEEKESVCDSQIEERKIGL